VECSYTVRSLNETAWCDTGWARWGRKRALPAIGFRPRGDRFATIPRWSCGIRAELLGAPWPTWSRFVDGGMGGTWECKTLSDQGHLHSSSIS